MEEKKQVVHQSRRTATNKTPAENNNNNMPSETMKLIEAKLASKSKRHRSCSFFDAGCPDVALKSLFKKYDVNHDGQLSREELLVLFQEDLGLDDQQCEIYMYILDRDGDDSVSWDEFLFWMRSKERLQNVTDKVRYQLIRQALDLFQSYDKDHNFALDKNELKTVLINSGGRVENIETALQELDKDHNGNVSFLEFLSWLNWIPTEEVFFDHLEN